MACEDCGGCVCDSSKCDVVGCGEEALVFQMATGKKFCIRHAWKSDRPDENGLHHPTRATWDENDIIRAHALGIKIGAC